MEVGEHKGENAGGQKPKWPKKYRIATITVATITVVTMGTCLQSQTGLDKMFYRFNLEKVLVVVKCGDFYNFPDRVAR